MALDSRRYDRAWGWSHSAPIPASLPDLHQIWPDSPRRPGRLGSGTLAAITPESVAGLLRRAHEIRQGEGELPFERSDFGGGEGTLNVVGAEQRENSFRLGRGDAGGFELAA